MISVIICTRNRAKLLANVLQTVCQQTLKQSQYEIIVVDNNATDDTATVTQSFGQRYPNVRYILEGRQGLSHARNQGWQAAKGEYIAYIDDDCEVPEGWLTVAKEIIDQVSPDVFGGPYFAFYNTAKPAWFKDQYGSWQPAQQATFIRPNALHGGNLFLRRTVLEQFGGFKPTLGMAGNKIGYGEETDLLLHIQANQPQTTFYYDPRLFVYHLVRAEKLSIRWYIRARFASGQAAYRVKQLHYRQKQDPMSLLKQMFKITRALIWEMSLGTLRRDRSTSPHYQNYWYEIAFRHLYKLGIVYEHYRFIRSNQVTDVKSLFQ